MDRCKACKNWHGGEGTRDCLKCSYYKHYCLKSVPRSKIPIDIVPASILAEFSDDFDDNQKTLTALQHLPDDLSLLLAARYVAKIPTLSLAALLQTSERHIERKQAVALAELKKMLRKDFTYFDKKRVG